MVLGVALVCAEEQTGDRVTRHAPLKAKNSVVKNRRVVITFVLSELKFAIEDFFEEVQPRAEGKSPP
jgi:hypothetical protein